MNVVSISSCECAFHDTVFRFATAALVGEISRETVVQAGKWGDLRQKSASWRRNGESGQRAPLFCGYKWHGEA